MSRFRNLIFLLLLAFLFVEVLLVFPREVRESTEAPPASQSNGKSQKGPVEQRAEGIHLVESQGNTQDWELFAKKAEGSQTQTWTLRDVKALFYKEAVVSFTVTGKSGVVDTQSKDMQIKGTVETTSANGYRFWTEDVKYQAKSRHIVSPTRVKMIGPADKDGSGLKVEGTRLMADVASGRMQIFADVKAEKVLRSGRRLRLTAHSAEFSGKNQQATFRGKVVLSYGAATIEAPEAELFSGAAGDLLSSVRLVGGVKVSDQDKFATSESLNLDLVLNQFILNGQPKVYQGQDELSGERIIFLDDGKKVKVEGVRAQMKESK